MIKTKYFASSISVSFASVFLFSSLFAACCFTFLYLQPLQDNGSDDHHLHDLNVAHSNRKTKMDVQLNQLEKLAVSPSPVPEFEDLVNLNSPVEDEDGGGVIQELVGNSTSPSDVVVEHDSSTSSDPPKVVAEDGNQGVVHQKTNNSAVVEDGHQGLIDLQGVKSTDTVNSIAPTMVVEDGNQGVASVSSESPMMIDDGDQGAIEQGVPNSTADPSVRKEEDGNEDSESTPDAVNLFRPPFNVSAEERMAWFKESVPRMKVFESTKRTRVFDQRIQEFFKGCKVRFFMTWIAPSRLFGKREMLSLESVFKAHPTGCVVLVSKSMDSKGGRSLLKPLTDLGYKVHPVAPDLSLLFNDTPAGPWLAGLKAGKIDPGAIPITQNLSNLLRLVVLYKYGGIYLDVDVIVIKDVSGLRNSVGIQTVDHPSRIWTSLNNAVLIFDKNHPLLLKLIEEFTTNFNGNLWGHNGPYMVSRVIMRVAFNDPAYDFNIMSPTAFYPVDWVHIPRYFREPMDANETQWTYDEDFVLKQRSYTVHLWNQFTGKLKIERHSLIGRLISDHCILCKHIYDTDSTSTSTSS